MLKKVSSISNSDSSRLFPIKANMYGIQSNFFNVTGYETVNIAYQNKTSLLSIAE